MWVAVLLLFTAGFCSGRVLQQQESNVTVPEGGGFLSDELPLKIVVSTPSELADNSTKRLKVRDEQALTVVYSRSVIALGQDFGTTQLPDDKIPFFLEPEVPGRFRWVATYIARWDPDSSWPLDSEIRFKFNDDLKTHDGISIQEGGDGGEVVLVTPSLEMDIGEVKSEKASNLTDDGWSATRGLDSDFLPEVPPDGVIALTFNTEVSLTALQEHLKVLDAASKEPVKGLTVEIEPCSSGYGRFLSRKPCLGCEVPKGSVKSKDLNDCAEVSINGDIEIGTRYAFSLAKGVVYSERAGSLKTAKSVTFGGLRTFRIPFVEDFYGDRLDISTNFLRLWLPHGLQKTDNSSIQGLKEQFAITSEGGDEVDFELELENNSTLRISTSFIPETNYTIAVDPSSEILDGFGLPLELSSIQISTGRIQSSFQPFQTFHGYAIFEAGQDWGQKIVAAAKGTPRGECTEIDYGPVDIFPVIGAKNIKAIPLYFEDAYLSDPLPLSQHLGNSIGTLQQENKGVTELVEFDIEKFLNPIGLVAAAPETCRRYQAANILINESDMQALILGSEAGPAIVWVASMKTGEPVEGATVTLGKYQEEPKLPREIAQNETDAEGRAFFMGGLQLVDFAHVEHRKKSLFVRNVADGYDSTSEAAVALVLDRRMVKPGETLHVKGYSRGNISAAVLEVTIYPAFDPESAGTPDFPIALNKNFGSFELEIPVPKNATITEYTISFAADSETLALNHFTVGDPRPPTVGLTVDAPFWSKPDGRVILNITAESFIGAAVGDADITLKWSIPGTAENSGGDLEGELELVTDAVGKVSAEIDLGLLERMPLADTNLNIDVSWVGPTRELVEESVSVLLRNADIEIKFDRTVDTDFPGQEFGVKVSLTDLLGMPLKNRTLVLNLKEIPSLDADLDELPLTATQPLNGSVVSSCEIRSNSEGFDCRFSIPNLGDFALETCVAIEAGSEEQLCRVVQLGRSIEMWRDYGIVEDHLSIGLVSLSKGPHKVGDKLKFGLENPYINAKALVVWGGRAGINHLLMPLNDSSLHEFSIKLGETCARGCGLSVGVMIPRQTEGIAMNAKGVPVAKLFDLAMPHATELSYNIEVATDEPLEVEISFPNIAEDEAQDFVVAPGDATAFQVNITDPGIDGAAEVTVVAVDKAILELLPYALKDLTTDLKLSDSFEFGFSSSAADLVSPHAIQALIHDFLRKKDVDPWFEPAIDLGPSYSSAVDQSDEQFVDARSTFVTVPGGSEFGSNDIDYDYAFEEAEADAAPFLSRSAFIRGGGGGALRAKSGSSAAAADLAAAPLEAPSAPPPLATSSVRVLEEFVSTALFETVVAKDGIATVEFTAPDNVGTFNVRAYVATETEMYGSTETELIVRRAISLTPSVPRFARVGDEFEAGAVVTVSGANPTKGNVSIAIDLPEGGALEIIGDSARAIRVGEDGTEEVRFRFKAKQMGEAEFKIAADIGPSGSDALVINFPVEGLQEAVTLASSFAIDGNSSSQWQERLQLPEAIPGSGGVAIQAGVGRMPAVLSIAGQIFESNPEHQCPIVADFALAAVTIPFVTETYKVLDLESAGLDSKTLDVVNGIQSNLTAGLESLQEMTQGDIGLDYFLSCKKFPRTLPQQPSLTTNARGVLLLSLLMEDLKAVQREGVENGIPPLMSLNDQWMAALETALLSEARNNRQSNGPIYIGSVAVARAALGGDWVAPPKSSDEIVEDLSMERLSKEFDSMGTESQAYYAVARISMGGGEAHPDIQKAVKSWTSNFRVTGRTAYIAHSKGAAAPASNAANSLALMVMVRAKVENPLLEKLANYVSSPPVSQYGFRVFSNYEKSLAMLALRDYDVDRGSNQPELKLEVNSGDFALLDVEFIGNTNPVASSSTPWESLASPPDPLEFRASGTGEVTLAAALTFVPAQLLPFPTYRGIFVQRSISIAESEETNKASSLTTVPVTSVVEVSIQLTTPDRLGPTTVRVLVPAGLEPLDPNISGSAGSCAAPLYKGDISSFFACPDQETKPSVVTFRYNSVNAGTQTISFRAVAATVGTFALPPVKAFVNEQPEVMGLSPAGELEICSGVDCVAVEDAPPKTPKSCPKNCSDSGACDLDSGTCLCFGGFKGEDCSELAVA